MPTTDLSLQRTKIALNNTQSTHGAAAEASSGRVLIRLREDFPSASGMHEPITEREKIYIRDYLSFDQTRQVVSIRPPRIQGILEFIDYVLKQDTLPFNDVSQRNSVFSEVIRIVNFGHDHFTKNKYFNGTQLVEVDASLGEVLNLVCLASMFQEQRYSLLNPEGYNRDRNARVLSIFSALERLSKDSVCSAGRQHEILFLLNRVYPVQQPDGNYQAIILIEDVFSFLLERLYTFLGQQAKRSIPTEYLLAHTRLWIKHQVGIDPEPHPSLESWLSEKIPPLKGYLADQCLHYGLNPNEVTIRRAIEEYSNIPDFWNVPADINPLVPDLIEIYSAKINADDDDVHRNNALTHIKKHIEAAALFDDLKAPVILFLKAERLYQYLKKYKALTVFLGEEEGSFKYAIESMYVALDEFFKYSSLEFFERATEEFFAQERLFKLNHPIDFIDNFFSIIMADPVPLNIEKQINRLIIEHKKQSLFLNDSMIRRCLIKQTGNELEITPYEVNRVLLHALLLSIDTPQEPVNFKPILIEIVSWLQKPAIDESIAHNAFRLSYFKTTLSNLLFITLMKEIPLTESSIGLNSNNFFQSMMIDFFSQKTLDLHVFATLWSSLEPNLAYMIQDSKQLISLLSLSEARLTQERRSKLMNALKFIFPILIENITQLISLLNLSETQLSQSLRIQIMNTLGDSLSTMLQDGYQLNSLFMLSERKFTQPMRSQALNIVKNKLPILIKNISQLGSFFYLSEAQFTNVMRLQMLGVVENHLGTIIQDGYQLTGLFRISEAKLTQPMRVQILRAIENFLGTIIQDRHQLTLLLKLSVTELTPEMRVGIWRTLLLSGFLQESYENYRDLARLSNTALYQAILELHPPENRHTPASFFQPALPSEEASTIAIPDLRSYS